MISLRSYLRLWMTLIKKLNMIYTIKQNIVLQMRNVIKLKITVIFQQITTISQ